MSRRLLVRWRKSAAQLLLLTVVGTLLAGCWDFRQLDERAFVLMMGIDKGPEGEGYRVTIQEVMGQYMAGAQSGGSGGAGGRKPWFTREGTGENLTAALSDLRTKVHRELELYHLKVIVLGEEVAREDLRHLILLHRDAKIPETAYVAVAQGEARPVLTTPAAAQDIPALYVFHGYAGARYTRAMSALAAPNWYIFNRGLHNPLIDAVAGSLEVRDGQLAFAGSAVWAGEGMAGWLTQNETALLNLFLRLKPFAGFLITQGKDGTALRISGGASRFWVERSDGGSLVLRLSLRTSGELVSYDGQLVGPETQYQVEADLARVQREEVERLVRRLQELGADPLGFGERLRRLEPSSLVVSARESWIAAYRSAEVRVDSEVAIQLRGSVR